MVHHVWYSKHITLVCLVMAGRLVWPYDHQGYAGGSIVLLAGLTMPDWSAWWGFRLKQHQLGSHKNPLREGKPWQKNHWTSRLWGLGSGPITCPRKIQKITETVTYQEEISNGEAVPMDGQTAGHNMTPICRSLWEAHRLTRSLATPKSKMCVGCWNILTMYTVRKAAQVAQEMERYRLDLMGLSEIRWTEVKYIWNNSHLYCGCRWSEEWLSQ